jgi:hypothetical protein
MSSRVVFDMGVFKKKMREASQRAENAIADQVIADSRQYCPTDGENTLRDSARVEHEDGSTQVTYNTPYAAYQYYGCWPDGSHVVKHHTTAGTTTKWIEHAKASNNEKWLRVAKNAMREL